MFSKMSQNVLNMSQTFLKMSKQCLLFYFFCSSFLNQKNAFPNPKNKLTAEVNVRPLFKGDKEMSKDNFLIFSDFLKFCFLFSLVFLWFLKVLDGLESSGRLVGKKSTQWRPSKPPSRGPKLGKQIKKTLTTVFRSIFGGFLSFPVSYTYSFARGI